MRLWQTVALVTVAAGSAVSAAGAQAAGAQQSACQIDDSKPNQVKDARNALVKAQLVSDKQKQLAEAVKLLTKDVDKIGNPVGRNWVLGRTLVTIASQPGAQLVVPRGSVGYATEPEGQVDLLLAADSAFDVVEQAMPQCVPDVEEYRRVLYVPVVNEAVNAYNAKNMDEAVRMSQRTLVIYPKSPIAFNVLANVAQSKEDFRGAVEHYKAMIAAIGSDTAYAEERQQTMLQIGVLLTAMAEEKEGAEKQALVKEAVEAYTAYNAAYPNDSKGQSGLARVQLMSGDSTAANQIFGTMIANPDKYSDMQLFEAGVNASRAERNKDAAALFEAGLKKNPYYRDALFNLAAMYDAMEAADKMEAPLRRLLEVDPNNRLNHQLVARMYQARAKAEKDAAKKKVLNDSLIAHFEMFQNAPVNVTFDLFSMDAESTKRVLGGTVENLSDKPATYTMNVEFLDTAGKVVASKQADIGQVAAKEKKTFRVEVDAPGIAAFKYAPLTGK
jgi:tetratricopeptide (TPR) repeat protein